MADIFISYSCVDKKFVQLLVPKLKKLGYSVWWDASLLAGSDFSYEIETELNKAKCVIVVWSNSSIQSNWVRGEATYAQENNLLLPVSIEEVIIPIPFNLIHTVDLSSISLNADLPSNFQESIKKILKGVSQHLQRGKTVDYSSLAKSNIQGSEKHTDKTQLAKKHFTAHENIKDKVTDIRIGTIESFKDNLLINGERVGFTDIHNYNSRHIYKKINYGNIIIHILKGFFKGLEKFVESYIEIIKWIFLEKKLLAIFVFFIAILVTILNKNDALLEINFINIIVQITNFIFTMCLFLIYLILLGFLVLSIFIGIVKALEERYLLKEEKHFYIEIVTENKVFRIWINHKDGYGNSNKVYDVLKETIFNVESNRVMIYIDYNHVSVKEKANNISS